MFNRSTRTWLVQGGETLASIALEVYTDPTKATEIQAANKVVVKDPNNLQRGWKLYIPALNRDTGLTTAVARDENGNVVNNTNYRLTIDNQHIEYIGALQYSSGQAKAARTMAFSIPAEAAPDAKVGSTVQLTINGILWLDGWLIEPQVQLDKDSGHVINWQATTKIYPVVHSNFKSTGDRPASWTNISLADLITNVLEGFGINLVLPEGSVGRETFDKIGFEGTETIINFIISVAQKKKYSLQGLANGDLFLYRADQVGEPVASFNDVSRMSAQYSYEGLGNEYRAVSQKSGSGGAGTATNDLIPFNIFKQITQDRGNEGDLTGFAQYKQAQLFAESLKLNILTETIFNDNDEIWSPGDVATILAPQLGFPNDTTFVLDSPNFDISRNGHRVSLEFVLPELRRGEMPGSLPFL